MEISKDYIPWYTLQISIQLHLLEEIWRIFWNDAILKIACFEGKILAMMQKQQGDFCLFFPWNNMHEF